MSESFQLYNPLVLGGKIKSEYEANSDLEAAKQVYEDLTQSLSLGKTPLFYMTLKSIDDDKLYHFVIKETEDEDKNIDYEINRFTKNIDKARENKCNAALQKMQAKYTTKYGGNTIDDDTSSSSEDSSDSEKLDKKIKKKKKKMIVEPVNMFWYYPLLYDVTYTYIPVISTYIPNFYVMIYTN